MTLSYKKYLVILFFVSGVAYSQSPPSPTSQYMPYIAYPGRNCSVFQHYPKELRHLCSVLKFWDASFPEGIIIINQARGADISEARENWLILADGRDGTIKLSNLLPLSLKHHQVLMGVVIDGQKPALSFLDSSTVHLIHVQEAVAMVSNMQLEGTTSGTSGTLLYTNRSLASLIYLNIFNTSPVKSIGVYINNDQNNEMVEGADPTRCNYSIIDSNTFNLSNFSLGIRISCQYEEERSALLIGNQFNLSSDSTGLQMTGGSFNSLVDSFRQTQPAASENRPPIAILLNLDSQPEDSRSLHHSIIQCDTFDGGEYGELVPVSLAHQGVGSDEPGHHRVTIAYSTFRNVPVAVSGDTSFYTISPDSICNIWLHDDDDGKRARCPATLPNNGFLHFTDGVTCGTPPENFVEPDCAAGQLHRCFKTLPPETATIEPAREINQASQSTVTMASRHQCDEEVVKGNGNDNIRVVGAGISLGTASVGVTFVIFGTLLFVSHLLFLLLKLRKNQNLTANK